MNGGGSSSAHLKVAKAFGVVVPEVIEEPPEIFKHIWEWFLELSAQRGSGFNGAEPLRYSDIQAWAFLTEQFLASHETRLLVELDTIFMTEISKRRDREVKASQKKKGK